MIAPAAAPSGRGTAIYAAFVFLLTAIALALTALPLVQDMLVQPLVMAIAVLATGLIDAFGGAILREGNVLTDTVTGATVHVTQACDGLGVFAVFAAMIVGLRRSWRETLVAIAALFAAIQLFNLVRVIALFHLRSGAQEVYDTAHLFVMPWATAMIGSLIVWRVWARPA